MDLLEISNQIEANESTLNKEHITFKPIRKTDYTLPQFNPPTKLNGNNRPVLSKVYSFILLNQRRRFADGATIMPISVTEKRLLCITGSAMNSSNLIKYMVNLGLLTVEDAHYQYNAYYEKDNKSKAYVYYAENEQKILEFIKDNHIASIQIINYKSIDIHTIVKDVSMTTFDTSKVRFSSKLHLTKPTNMSVSDFQDFLRSILYQRYPNLKHYMQLADYINNKYYHDDLARQIVFDAHFAWAKGNKYIRKIGIRATNHLVNAKTNNITGYEDDSILMKKDVLDEYGLNLEYDVKSSVPRITYFMNTGIWKKRDCDFYHDIYIQYGGSEAGFTPETRAAVKKLHMRGYFDSVPTIGVHTRRAMNSSDKSIDEVMKKLKVAIEVAEGGNTLDSEVFYHESCIYMDVLKELLDRGFDCWEVYDSWYASKAGCTQEEYTEIVEEVIEKVVQDYDKVDVADNTSTDIHNKSVHNNSSDILLLHTIVKDVSFDTSDLANQALLL